MDKKEPKAAAADATAEEKLTEVKLAKPHTHGGEDKKAGDTIKVNPLEQKWLEENGVIEKA